MFNNCINRLLTLCLALFTSGVFANSTIVEGLSDNHRISSKYLKYDLQYRVYLPKNYAKLTDLSVIYLTDGQSYIESGEFHLVLDKLIEENKIEPIMAVFIDPRDPDNLSINRRNYEFFCNEKYIEFVNLELIKTIEQQYKVTTDPQNRVMMGLSFGGLNAACFGLLSHHTFRNLVMQSPAMHPIPNINQIYQNSPPPPLNVYLSTGTINDGEKKTQRFKRMLKSTGHQVKFKSTKQGHNWRNWKPMLDNILLYFFSTKPATK